jgi:hypothetical protein
MKTQMSGTKKKRKALLRFFRFVGSILFFKASSVFIARMTSSQYFPQRKILEFTLSSH